MNKLLLIAAALVASCLWSVPAMADTFAGHMGCNSQATMCSNTFQIKQKAQQRTQAALNCDPTVGENCNAVQGETYVYHVSVRHTGGGGPGGSSSTVHYEWKATAFTVPTNPAHFILWSGISLTVISTNQYCNLH